VDFSGTLQHFFVLHRVVGPAPGPPATTPRPTLALLCPRMGSSPRNALEPVGDVVCQQRVCSGGWCGAFSLSRSQLLVQVTTPCVRTLEGWGYGLHFLGMFLTISGAQWHRASNLAALLDSVCASRQSWGGGENCPSTSCPLVKNQGSWA
jgi:hypothetical protein